MRGFIPGNLGGRWRSFKRRRLATVRQRVIASAMVLLVLIGVAIPLFHSSKAAAWWNGSWTYRTKVGINASFNTGSVSDFPIRVSLSAAKNNINYSHTKAAGADIRFVDSDDTTALDFEIESWNSGGTSELWVRKPTLLNTKTDYIWMYYGNAAASDGSNKTGVWQGNVGVWHMNEQGNGTTGEFKDSSSSVNNGTGGAGTAATTPTRIANGIIGTGESFDNVNDYITMPRTSSLNITTTISMSAWTKRSVISDFGAIMSKAVGGGTDYELFYCGVAATCASSPNSFGVYSDGPGGQISNTQITDTTTWHLLTVTRSGSTVNLYLDGALDFSGTFSGSFTNSNYPFQIGVDDLTSSPAFYGGSMDEVRLSNVQRTADYVRAEYKGDTDQMTTFAPEEVQNQAQEAWCNDASGVTCDTGWSTRRRVGFINAVSTTNLPNFPVLVKLDSSTIDYSKTQNSGQDIRFVDPSDPTTVLPHEIEKWNESGSSYVWVKVPQLSATSSSGYLWMYYGNSSASDGQAATGVWDASTIMVQHFEEGTCNASATFFSDSTANAQSGPCVNSGPTANASGVIGSGRTFNGTNQHVTINDNALFEPGSGGQTIEAWINTNNMNTYSGILAHFNGAGGGWTLYMNGNFGGGCGATNSLCFWNGNTDVGVTTSFATSTWVHVATVQSGTTVTFYINGVVAGTAAASALPTNSPSDIRIGEDGATGGAPFSGSMDEVRYESTNRSADWMNAEYRTQDDLMNTFGNEEYSPPSPPVLTALTGGTISTTPTFQLRAADQSNPTYLRYKIEVCSNSDCSSILRTIDQTSSQTGWSGQDAQSGTAYVAAATVGSSTLASHTYQAPALTAGTQYWWRAYAIDPADTNTFGSASAISSFITAAPPAAPTLIEPVNNSTVSNDPLVFKLWTTDANSDNVQYKIDVCATSNCSSILRTINQTSTQVGWSSQNADSATTYTTTPTLSTTTQQAAHTYQSPGLSLALQSQYWWRAYAIDPAGSNVFGPVSGINTFFINSSGERIMGGTTIKGGTKIGQ